MFSTFRISLENLWIKHKRLKHNKAKQNHKNNNDKQLQRGEARRIGSFVQMPDLSRSGLEMFIFLDWCSAMDTTPKLFSIDMWSF